uniref:Uncharacterized protein n=1 Tax=Candidatus Kentrum sp. TC TaxID=2126339 RepID=A0A450YNR8_9GAMM|nr:MAG: hypothetical protein BECKTC1821D_GA0114238_101522 [Candidatus Kentron sp. TC]
MKESLIFGVRDIRIKDSIVVIDLSGFSDTNAISEGNNDSGCRLMMTLQAMLQLHGGIDQLVTHLMEEGIVSQKMKEKMAPAAPRSPNFDGSTG